MTKGFTLIEMIIVAGILVLIAGVGLPITVNAYKNYLLTTEVKNFLSILRRAENFALANEGGASYGVYLLPTKFVLFRGASYATRNTAYDEEYNRAGGVSITGATEIVFTPVTGMPNTTSTWSLSNGQNPQTISINEQGALSW